MPLTEKQEINLKKMPMLESQVSKSRDGKFVIHKTIITNIKPLKYWQTVVESEPETAQS